MRAPKPPSPGRLDRALVQRGLVDSRARAQELVRRGAVRVGGKVVQKAAATVGAADVVEIAEPLRFVSRGGEKLDGACEALRVAVRGRACLDVGASTGGFTDCLLQRGARAVCAVDVGTDLLAPALRRDPRVTLLEGINARALTPETLPFHPELVVVDASFISLGVLAPVLAALLEEGGELLALVKPQFEVGRDEARRRRGVVPDGPSRDDAIAGARTAVAEAGFEVLGSVDSALSGPRGNVEHFLHARRVAAQNTKTQRS